MNTPGIVLLDSDIDLLCGAGLAGGRQWINDKVNCQFWFIHAS